MKEYLLDSNAHSKKVKKFHDWDAIQYMELRYHDDSCEGLAYLTRKQLVMSLVNVNSGKVLDIGCGPGVLTRDLINKNLQVYSADLSIKMIKQAKRRLYSNTSKNNAYFVVSNISDICFSGNKMDIILCIGVVCYVRNYNCIISEIHRILKPGGVTIIQIDKIRWPSVYKKLVPLYQYLKSKITSKNYEKLDFEFNLFSYDNFIKDLEKNGFLINDLQYYDFRIPFIDIIFPKLSIKFGKIMFKNHHSKLYRCFAHGLLIKASTIR